jgi:hypothetical protein
MSANFEIRVGAARDCHAEDLVLAKAAGQKKDATISKIAGAILSAVFGAGIGSVVAGYMYGFTLHNVLVGALVGAVAVECAAISLVALVAVVSLAVFSAIGLIMVSKYEVFYHTPGGKKIVVSHS